MRILIADDHAVVRSGLRTILGARKDWNVCAEAQTGDQAVALTEKLHPDVAILDLGMPGISGIEAAAEIRRSMPNVEIVMLTCHYSQSLLLEVSRLGVLGFVLKSDACTDLIAAVDAVQKGERYTSKNPDVVLALVASPDPLSSMRADGEPLTNRERDEVRIIADEMKHLL